MLFIANRFYDFIWYYNDRFGCLALNLLNELIPFQFSLQAQSGDSGRKLFAFE